MNFKNTIEELIAKTPYTKQQVAKTLGMARSTLFRRLENPDTFTIDELETLGNLTGTPAWQILQTKNQ